jgi:hypothetical protein
MNPTSSLPSRDNAEALLFEWVNADSLRKHEQCSISEKHTNRAQMMSTDETLQQSKLTSNSSGASSVPKCFCPSDSHTHHKGWK